MLFIVNLFVIFATVNVVVFTIHKKVCQMVYCIMLVVPLFNICDVFVKIKDGLCFRMNTFQNTTNYKHSLVSQQLAPSIGVGIYSCHVVFPCCEAGFIDFNGEIQTADFLLDFLVMNKSRLRVKQFFQSVTASLAMFNRF